MYFRTWIKHEWKLGAFISYIQSFNSSTGIHILSPGLKLPGSSRKSRSLSPVSLVPLSGSSCGDWLGWCTAEGGRKSSRWMQKVQTAGCSYTVFVFGYFQDPTRLSPGQPGLNQQVWTSKQEVGPETSWGPFQPKYCYGPAREHHLAVNFPFLDLNPSRWELFSPLNKGLCWLWWPGHPQFMPYFSRVSYPALSAGWRHCSACKRWLRD